MRGWWILVFAMAYLATGCGFLKRYSTRPCFPASELEVSAGFDMAAGTMTGAFAVWAVPTAVSTKCQGPSCRKGGGVTLGHIGLISAVASALYFEAASIDHSHRRCPAKVGPKQPSSQVAQEGAVRQGRPGRSKPRMRLPMVTRQSRQPGQLRCGQQNLARATGHSVRFTLTDGSQAQGQLRLYNGMLAVIATPKGNETIQMRSVIDCQVGPRGGDVPVPVPRFSELRGVDSKVDGEKEAPKAAIPLVE